MMMPREEPATLAIIDGRVWTGDTMKPWAEAVALRGDRIAAVGSNTEIRHLIVPSTRVIDAHGGTVSARNDDGALFEISLPLHSSARTG
jgi:hypothetical protein